MADTGVHRSYLDEPTIESDERPLDFAFLRRVWDYPPPFPLKTELTPPGARANGSDRLCKANGSRAVWPATTTTIFGTVQTKQALQRCLVIIRIMFLVKLATPSPRPSVLFN